MKKVILLFALLVSTLSFSQEAIVDTNFTPYIGMGVSITNTDQFTQDSYISAEVGVMYENVSLAGVFGRNNLDGFHSSTDSISDYWYEGKVAVSTSLGYVDGYVLGGVGAYIDGGDVFVEYGAGISREYDFCIVFLQVSNWDGTNYITPGVAFPL